MTLPEFAGYALDLDGTVYLGDELLPGAGEAIAALRARGARVVFVTNKPLETAADYAAKLTRLGVPAEPADVVTAVDALVRYLRERHAGRAVLLIAEHVVADRLREDGVPLAAGPQDADVVVVSFDRTFDYAKLHAAYRAVRERHAVIVATNPDPYCPTPDGGLPDCGAMLAALEACTGARAEAIVGKPSEHMASAFLDRLGVDPAQAAVVGDRLATDVAMGRHIGAAGILVLSGATSAEDVAAADIRPDHVISGIHELVGGAPYPMIEFIFMLTRDDVTVADARDVLAEVRDAGLRYVGFKDIGPEPPELRRVTADAHAAGMEVMLEVVSTSREDELRSLRAALDIGVDWVLGGTNAQDGAGVLSGTGVRYCPFPGTITGHPSVLSGEIADIAADAARLTALDGVHGVDLLAYRHATADVAALTRAVADAIDGPVIAAGSVATLEQIGVLAQAGAWGFTIGSAIFEQRLPGGPSVAGQVRAVLDAAAAS